MSDRRFRWTIIAVIGLTVACAIALLLFITPREGGSASGYGSTTHGSSGPSPAVWWALGRASAPQARPVVVHSPAPAPRYTPPSYSPPRPSYTPPRPSYTPPRSFSSGTPKPSFGSSSRTRSFSSSSRPSFGGKR